MRLENRFLPRLLAVGTTFLPAAVLAGGFTIDTSIAIESTAPAPGQKTAPSKANHSELPMGTLLMDPAVETAYLGALQRAVQDARGDDGAEATVDISMDRLMEDAELADAVGFRLDELSLEYQQSGANPAVGRFLEGIGVLSVEHSPINRVQTFDLNRGETADGPQFSATDYQFDTGYEYARTLPSTKACYEEYVSTDGAEWGHEPNEGKALEEAESKSRGAADRYVEDQLSTLECPSRCQVKDFEETAFNTTKSWSLWIGSTYHVRANWTGNWTLQCKKQPQTKKLLMPH